MRRLRAAWGLLTNRKEFGARLTLAQLLAYIVRRKTPTVWGRLDYRTPVYLKVEGRGGMPRLESCRKEPETVSWIEQYVVDGDVFYDVGANVGAYALIAATKVGTGGLVIAFEPSFSNFGALVENSLYNKLETRVVPLLVALGDEEKLATFEYSSIEAGAALHGVIDDGAIANGKVTSKVQLAPLDTLVERYRLPEPSVIKIDVDGLEHAVIEGAKATLKRSRLKAIIIEIDLSHPANASIEATLRAEGFTVKDRQPRGKGKSETLFNFLFVREA